MNILETLQALILLAEVARDILPNVNFVWDKLPKCKILG